MTDKKLEKLVQKEIKRQEEGLIMIPSENLASKYVLSFLNSELNNKYSEGYPGKRYYTGNRYIDEIESLANERAKEIFDMDHSNMQPLSGANANYAAISALIEPGQKILSMKLDHGGHLTHGMAINYSGKLYKISHYGVDQKTQVLDYKDIKNIAKEEKPDLIISGASSYPREIDFYKITDIARSVGAKHLADISHIAGLIAKNLHISAKSADVVTFTTHKTMRGPRGAVILCKKEYAQAIDKAVFPGLQGGPHEHVIAAKAANLLEVHSKHFELYQKQILKNAKTLEKVFLDSGLKLITGGTDNHLLLIDVRPLDIDGNEGALALEKAFIYTNKNVIPYDTGSAVHPSGVRLGTPYLTARGMKESEMQTIAGFIVDILKDPYHESLINKIKKEVIELAKNFPIDK